MLSVPMYALTQLMLTLSYTVPRHVRRYMHGIVAKSLRTPYTVKYMVRGGYLSVDGAVAKVGSYVESIEKRVEYLSATVIAFGLLLPLGIAVIGCFNGSQHYVTLAKAVSVCISTAALLVALRDRYIASLVDGGITFLALVPTFASLIAYFMTGSVLIASVASLASASPFIVRSREPNLRKLKAAFADGRSGVFELLDCCRPCGSNSSYLVYGSFSAKSLECAMCYTSVKLVEELGPDAWVLRSLALIIDSFENVMRVLRSRLFEVQVAALLAATISLVLSLLAPYGAGGVYSEVDTIVLFSAAALARLGSRSVWTGLATYSACVAVAHAWEVAELWSTHLTWPLQ